MDSFHFLHDPATGQLFEGRFGPHPEVPEGLESVDTGLGEIPEWFPRHAVYENGEIREMTAEEKSEKRTRMERDEKTRQFDQNRALHAAFKVFLEEINQLRTAAGVSPLEPSQLKERIRQEYLAI